MWPLTDTALVDENYRAAFFLGFFLMAGHCRCFHPSYARDVSLW
jgi:hypothetical protein